MKRKIAISKPQKIKIVPSYKVDCRLVANKGDFMGRSFPIFGKKLFYETDVWDFGPFGHDIVVEGRPEYIRIGDDLFRKSEIRIIYSGSNWDSIYLESNEEAEKRYKELVERFGLVEIEVDYA